MEVKNYWKGLEELNQTPEFQSKRHNEFPEHLPIEEVFDDNIVTKPRGRRDFLKILGFSATAAGIAATSCEAPVRKAIPYVVKPEDITPGVANWYASTFYDGNEYCSVLVKTREGRPIKIEGNKMSSITKGGTSARVQASVLNLYDTCRMRAPHMDGEETTWAKVDAPIMEGLASIAQNQGGIRFLTRSIISPSTNHLLAEFGAKFGNMHHVSYDTPSYSGMIEANVWTFGKRALPSYHFDKAHMIVSFGADFLGTWLSPIEFTKQYSATRKLDRDHPMMSKHIQIETGLSITGSKADKRAVIKPSEMGAAVVNLYNKLAGLNNKPSLSGGDVSNKDVDAALAHVADKARSMSGKVLVVCGANDPDQQQVVNEINKMLGSYGSTIDMDTPDYTKQGTDKEFKALIDDMNGGKVDALFISDVNPAYDSPLAKEFAEAVKKVKVSVSFNGRMDETSSLVKYCCPGHHYLETWDDAMPKAGHFSIAQPTIAPLFKTRAMQESLLTWMGNPNKDYYSYIKGYWEAKVFPQQSRIMNFNTFWDRSVHDGVCEMKSGMPMMGGHDMEAAPVAAAPAPAAAEGGDEMMDGGMDMASTDLSAAASNIAKAPTGGTELMVYQKVSIGNGAYINNPWLLELPDPITKATWDNYVLVSHAMAKAKGLKDGDMVKVSANNHSLELPVIIQPGQTNDTISIAMGYGRTNEKAYKAAVNVGQDATPFTSYNGGKVMYYATNATVEPTGNNMIIARTQTHHHVEGRPIIKETTLKEYKENRKAGNTDREQVQHHLTSLYPAKMRDYNGTGPHWGMSIDLNSCTGCAACSIACTAENNVPVVGKDQIWRARDMHWMRIDRYYAIEGAKGVVLSKEEDIMKEGELDFQKVEVVFQPMLCQHCDNAPCENVCPVAATNHSTEGLNQMAYNRCIGTRYCENNCPYKVRRFNWYDYAGTDSFSVGILNNDDYPGRPNIDMLEDLTRMVLNPDVTVRSRGVMEKCSFCVQRIQEAKLNAKRENRPLKDGDVVVACQQACPADAIVFGDRNNENSVIYDILGKGDHTGHDEHHEAHGEHHEGEHKPKKKHKPNERAFAVLEEIHTLPSIEYLTLVRNKEA